MAPRIMRMWLIAASAVLCAMGLVLAPFATAAAEPGAGLQLGPLPLGSASLVEQRVTQEVAPGITLTRISRGAADPSDSWTVTAAWAETLAAAQSAAAQLAAAGHPAAIVTVEQRAPDDPHAGPLGYAVRVGSFATQGDAAALQATLAGLGFKATSLDFTGEDGTPTSGPWELDVLTIDRHHFRGALANVQAAGTIAAGLDKVSNVAARFNALAGINGGYFVVGPTDGTPGDPAGISILDGVLAAEPVNGRTALLLDYAGGDGGRLAQIISDVRATMEAIAEDGSQHVVNGLDRVPGLIRACGRPGAQPTELPKHDFTCTNPNELIAFKPAFGSATPAGSGVEAVVDRHGRVAVVRARGGPIPADGLVLAGIGEAAEWLQGHAESGSRIRISTRLASEEGPLELRPGLGAVNGGPRLLRDQEAALDACTEGFCYPETGRFYWRFGVRRNPRTMAGVTPQGDLLLVAVDGRKPGHSVGLSFAEEVVTMRALGAADAINLDGGGSTTLTLGSHVENQPSDATGERPVGDAILVLPSDLTERSEKGD